MSEKRGEPVDAGDSDIWRIEMQIPSVPPTKLGGCRIIDVQYVLKVCFTLLISLSNHYQQIAEYNIKFILFLVFKGRDSCIWRGF